LAPLFDTKAHLSNPIAESLSFVERLGQLWNASATIPKRCQASALQKIWLTPEWVKGHIKDM
jgi:hypothetical protein